MRVLSVNVSPPKRAPNGAKMPVVNRVMLRRLHLDGDGQADPENHGGPQRAAYAYPIENHGHWSRELGRLGFAFGQFGENFTVGGMTEDEVRIGDVFRVGGALFEVSQPRPPCSKLGIKMGMPRFPRLFLASGRVGFYLRVLEEGEVGAGDAFERVGAAPEGMTVREMGHLLFVEPENLEGAGRALRIRALAPGWRGSFEERPAKKAGAS